MNLLKVGFIVFLFPLSVIIFGNNNEGLFHFYRYDWLKSFYDDSEIEQFEENKLFKAIIDGNTEQVKKEVAQGANVNNKIQGFYTPLMLASASGNKEIVKILIDSGAVIADKQEKQSFLDNRLVEDVFYPSIRAVEKWLAQGANANATVDNLPISYRPRDGGRTNTRNWTPLMFAADALGFGKSPENKGAAVEIAKVLITYGALVNQADTEGRTPLAIAVKNNDIEMAKLLLEEGANPNQAYTHTKDFLIKEDSLDRWCCLKSTPLVDAIKNNNTSLIDLLLDYGAQADMVVPNSLGDFTALKVVGKNNPAIIKSIEAHLSFWQRWKWRANRFFNSATY